MKRCFKVMDLLALMRVQVGEADEAHEACSLETESIELDMVRVDAKFPGGDVCLFLPHVEFDVPPASFFEKWIQPAMRPCVCGARQANGVLPCGH